MKFEQLLLYLGKNEGEYGEVMERIKGWADEKNLNLSLLRKGEQRPSSLDFPPSRTLLLTLGGDGTFLQAADLFAPSRIPMLGVNLGNLGFLTDLRTKTLEEGLRALEKGKYSSHDLLRLSCKEVKDADIGRGQEGDEPLTALNELVFSRKTITDFATFELFIDSERVDSYPGDGVIVSTPTGSTAYSLSCGGPLITAGTEALAIIPLNVHKLGLRPIICAADSDIRVKALTEGVLLADGVKTARISPGTVFELGRAEVTTRIISLDCRDGFFETVRGKLNWGQPREV